MRLVNFSLPRERGVTRLGLLVGDAVLDLEPHWAAAGETGGVSAPLPESVDELLASGSNAWQHLRQVSALTTTAGSPDRGQVDPSRPAYPIEQVVLQSPVAHPNTIRDFYAFEGHVARAFMNRGREIPREWYQVPVFYYSNTGGIYGSGEVVPCPSYTRELDYELEIACVIRKRGRNLTPAQFDDYVAGLTIFNDWSARDVQKIERAVGLGPAKAKDFASSLGPALVTLDELSDKATVRPGVYALSMLARVNGKELSHGNMIDIHYSFGDLLARASQDVDLYPGDVICSGTVGTGCLLELTQGNGPWLQPGDAVELEIERLGILKNVVGEP